jgi:RNA polymerase sigma-70 factor (ECF subfamily)
LRGSEGRFCIDCRPFCADFPFVTAETWNRITFDPNYCRRRIIGMQEAGLRDNLIRGAVPPGHLAKAGPLHDRPKHDGGKSAAFYAARTPAHLASLIEAIAADQDREAFAALFDYFAPRIKGFLIRSNTPPAAAEELAQEALLMVWRKAGQYDRTKAGASAWIFTIARNLRIDVARREQRGRLLDLEATDEAEPPTPPDAMLLTGEREQRVHAALAHLSDDQLRVVRLSFFEGKAHADIASELELPLGTVKSRIRLAMSRLRELLGDLT